MNQKMMGSSGIKKHHIQIICTLLQTDNHASTSPLGFYRLVPFLPPTNSVKALKAAII